MSNKPSFVLVLYPMRRHGAALESWRWPDTVRSEFGGFEQRSGEIWLDAASELPERLFDLMTEASLPRPCTSLLGYATRGALGPHQWFQLRLRETAELLQETDNYIDQEACGWAFPMLRTGISGCMRGGKSRRTSYRFPKRYKAPKYDLFWIAPGPRISGGVFGVADKALNAMLSSGFTEFDHRPILTFAGELSGFHEIEVTASAASPIRSVGCELERVCDVCGLSLAHASRSQEATSIVPPDVDLHEDDLQVIREVRVGDCVAYSDFWPPIVSRRFIDLVSAFDLTGLDKGGAGGKYEPFVTKSFAEQMNAWRPRYV
jgi:hypothetical protein